MKNKAPYLLGLLIILAILSWKRGQVGEMIGVFPKKDKVQETISINTKSKRESQTLITKSKYRTVEDESVIDQLMTEIREVLPEGWEVSYNIENKCLILTRDWNVKKKETLLIPAEVEPIAYYGYNITPPDSSSIIYNIREYMSDSEFQQAKITNKQQESKLYKSKFHINGPLNKNLVKKLPHFHYEHKISLNDSMYLGALLDSERSTEHKVVRHFVEKLFTKYEAHEE